MSDIAANAADISLVRQADQKYCFSCAALIHVSAQTCPKCGAQQARTHSKDKKSRIVAFILAFFLGWLGVHKFYLERPAQGVLYIIFCWTFIPGLIAFFESMIYLFMSNERFARQYDE